MTPGAPVTEVRACSSGTSSGAARCGSTTTCHGGCLANTCSGPWANCFAGCRRGSPSGSCRSRRSTCGRTCGAVVTLADGTRHEVDLAIVTTGHGITGQARGTLDDGLITAPYPLPEQVDQIPPGSTVALLGTGLTAMDVIAALTLGRGGEFTEGTYRPSGARAAHHPGESRRLAPVCEAGNHADTAGRTGPVLHASGLVAEGDYDVGSTSGATSSPDPPRGALATRQRHGRGLLPSSASCIRCRSICPATSTTRSGWWNWPRRTFARRRSASASAPSRKALRSFATTARASALRSTRRD